MTKSRNRIRGTKMRHHDSSTVKGQNTSKQGFPKALQGSERLLARTEAQPGQDLSDQDEGPLEKATSVELHRNISSAEAFRVITDSCIRQIVANEPGMCAGHAESLHQLRIGLRRLRVAIKAFKRISADPQQEAIRAELRWAMKQIGPARDLDVFGSEVLGRLDQIGTHDPDFGRGPSLP